METVYSPKMWYTERYFDFVVVVGGSCSCSNDSNNFSSVISSNRKK